MPKALSLSVFYNATYRKCAAGGITETAEDIYVLCDDGPFEIDGSDPRLFKLAKTLDSIHLEPVNPPAGPKTVGPMMGGSYAATSDARFSRACRSMLGFPFYGAVAVHDRFETPEMYEALSR